METLNWDFFDKNRHLLNKDNIFILTSLKGDVIHGKIVGLTDNNILFHNGFEIFPLRKSENSLWIDNLLTLLDNDEDTIEMKLCWNTKLSELKKGDVVKCWGQDPNNYCYGEFQHFEYHTGINEFVFVVKTSPGSDEFYYLDCEKVN